MSVVYEQGLTSEAQNLLRWSADFSQGWVLQNGAVRSDETSVLDGETASRIQCDSSSASQGISQPADILSGAVESFTLLLENVDATETTVGIRDMTASVWPVLTTLNWSAMTIGAGGAVTPLGTGPNGGALARVTVSGSGTAGNVRRVFVYPGGTALNSNASIIHWAQLEEAPAWGGTVVVTAADPVTPLAVPVNHPRVLWRRIAGTITATQGAPGAAAENADTYRTDEWWQPSSMPGTWTLTAASAQTVDYLAIGAHNLADAGATVQVLVDTGSGLVEIPGATVTPTDNGPVVFLFQPREVDAIAVFVTGSTAPALGVIQAGQATAFPRKAVYAPGLSLQRGLVTEYNSNVSQGGQWLGRSVARQRLDVSMRVDHLSEDWITAEFDAFAAHAVTSPFFMADRPAEFPDSVAYVWTGSDLRPQRGIPNARVANSVTIGGTGFVG